MEGWCIIYLIKMIIFEGDVGFFYIRVIVCLFWGFFYCLFVDFGVKGDEI